MIVGQVLYAAARHAFKISGKYKLQFIAATPRARCSKNGVKICCVERRDVSTHLFRVIINYWRCWKNSYRLVSWQIIGACSPNVAALKIRSCVVFRAIYKRWRNRCHSREWLATKSLAGSWLKKVVLW